MAGTLLHITLAEEIARDERLPSALRQELANHGHDYRLGAVLFDLPYFEDLLTTGFRVLLERPLQLDETGTFLHAQDPVGLLEQLLVHASDPAGRALCLGAITHYSVDLVFHPAICALVAAGNPSPRRRDALHKRIEDQVDLHVSFDRLGHSAVGTPYATKSLSLVPNPAWAQRFVLAAARGSGVAFDARRARLWLRRLHLFALAIRWPHSPFIHTFPEDNPALLDQSLSLARRALELGHTQVLAAHRVLRGDQEPSHLRQVLGSFALTDGSVVEPREATSATMEDAAGLPEVSGSRPRQATHEDRAVDSMTGRLVNRTQKSLGLTLALAAGFAVSAMASRAAAFTPWSPGKPSATALTALQSDALVNIIETRWYWAFQPTSRAKDVGFIFYPGAFIDERAYAPVIRALAEAGYPSFILKLPHDFAMTAPFLATYAMRDNPAIRSFAVGGHSVGGVVATIYCNHKNNPEDKIDGLALWSSYPSPLDTIANQSTQVISIWGTEDGLTSHQDIENTKPQLPSGATYVTIDGGNHAQFGDYGDQDGDNPATITRQEQQDQIVEAMLRFLGSLE